MTTIQAAICAAMTDIGAVGKKDRNTSQGFSFRGIDAVVNACAPALRSHGVVVMPNVLEHQYSTVTVGNNNKAMGHVLVKVAYTFHGPGGDALTCTVIGEAMDAGDKASSKAMSVAFRTALLQALVLPTDEPDPDAEVYERSGNDAARSHGTEIPRPVATDKQVAKWTAALSTAPDVTKLTAIAEEITGYVLPDDVRAELLDCFRGRKAELDG